MKLLTRQSKASLQKEFSLKDELNKKFELFFDEFVKGFEYKILIRDLGQYEPVTYGDNVTRYLVFDGFVMENNEVMKLRKDQEIRINVPVRSFVKALTRYGIKIKDNGPTPVIIKFQRIDDRKIDFTDIMYEGE